MDRVFETIKLFPAQCRQVESEFKNIALPDYKDIANILISAMGASAFGYHICKYLYKYDLQIPLCLHNDYNTPGFVSDNTLFIPVSYSGFTEEPLDTSSKSLKLSNKVIGIAQKESDLGQLLLNNNKAAYFINPVNNPSGQPRMGAGYTISALIKILGRLKLIKDENLTETAEFVEKGIPDIDKSAKVLADKLTNKYILIMSAEHLSGNAHVFRNQLNETAKNSAFYSLLPELNHHLLEGFLYPNTIKDNLAVVLISSDLYSNRIKHRMMLTRDVLDKNSITNYTIEVSGPSKIKQVFWVLAYSGFVSYYLSIRNKVNAEEIPWVNYFKKQLSALNDQ